MPKSSSTPTAPTKNDLDPVWIPNIAKPIPWDTGVDGGVGIHYVNNSLDVFVKVPGNTPAMTLFQLFWGSTSVPVAHAFMGGDDLGLEYITLTVKPHNIRPQWADPVYCLVTRPSQNVARTRPLRLRVKQTQPGGRDPNMDIDGHQGLNFSLPEDVVLDGVHSGNVGPGKGVDVLIHPYLHMSLFDTIRLFWGSELIEYRVEKQSEVGESVVVTVDYLTILKAGDDDMLKVAFQVRDAVGNFPDFYAPLSEVELVRVSLDLAPHSVPWLGEESDPDDEIYLAMLEGRDQRVSMFVSSNDFVLHDGVLLVFNGVDADGMAVTYTDLWSVDRLGRSHTFFVPYATVEAVAMGRATIFYEHQPRDGGVRQSKRLQVRIIGDPVPWPVPEVVEAPAGYLDPDVLNATVIFSAAPGWQPHQDLSVVWVTTHTDNPVHYRSTRKVGNIPPDREMLFTVPGREVKRFKGHSIEVYYELAEPGVIPAPRESKRLPLLVGAYVGDMPAAIIDKAEGGWLNPEDVPTGTLTTLPFAETEEGDQLILYWAASDDGVSHLFPVTIGAAGETVGIHVANAYIAPNFGKSVTVYYTLKRDGEPLRFSKVLTLFIGVLPLAIDPLEMVLDGLAVKMPDWPTTGVDAPGNTGFREPTGGTPPYTYSSSNPAAIDVVDGKVTGHTNGIANIRVTDAKGASVFYNVAVKNVYRLVINETKMRGDDAITWMQSINGATLFLHGGAVLNKVYKLPLRTEVNWGCADKYGEYYVFIHVYRPDIEWWYGIGPHNLLGAWCMVPT
ncbi:hypothetical protein ACI77M_07585 [Pseudomonas fildesensis]|uniref:hypothetical protein n=1 Tax=Pseudomonas fildesensis TaxID=1674920 RepID=UPI00387B15D9